MKESVFFAYQGKSQDTSDDNVDAIRKAISSFNQHQNTYELKSWEDYDKTAPINIEVLNAIDTSSIFVCDITHFNHNVVFELGYAIGKNRKVLILLNENISNACDRYNNFILKNIRYTSFTNNKDITAALQKKKYKADLLSDFINLGKEHVNTIDIFYIQSKHKSESSLVLTDSIDKYKNIKKLSIVTDDTHEVSYKPIEWYMSNIYKTKALIIHMVGSSIKDSVNINCSNSFWAGLALGLGTEVFLAAPSKYKAPLDYYDILVQYSDPINLVESVSSWLDNRFVEASDFKLTQDEVHDLNLLTLGVGCEVAEQENDTLLSYFVETAAYHAALNLQKSIIIGRKGSGKSAINIKLIDELKKEQQYYLVALKPQSDELLEDLELSDIFNSPTSKYTFFINIWTIVILSRLLLSISNKILLKDKNAIYNSAEQSLINYVSDNEDLLNLNIFGLIRSIGKKVGNSNLSIKPIFLEEIYTHYINPIISVIKEYYQNENTKYIKVIIMADNLDKTWDSKNNLETQSDLIISLHDATDKVKTLLTDKNVKLDVKQILFLRKDIYDYVLNNVNEPDKLVAMSYEINWENYPEKLRTVIENRFMHVLGLKDESETENIWKEFFDIDDPRHPFDIIYELITKRPRDMIYFVSRLFESAVNKGHSKVDKADLMYGIESYTTFLNKNLIAEVKAEYPEITDILVKLQQHHGKIIEYAKYEAVLEEAGYGEEKRKSFTKTLFNKDYLIGYDDKKQEPINDIDELEKRLSERRYFVLKNKVYVIAHAKYYYIKNNIFKSF